MNLNRFIIDIEDEYQVGDEVDLLIATKSEPGDTSFELIFILFIKTSLNFFSIGANPLIKFVKIILF